MKKDFVSVITEADVKKLFHTFMETLFRVLGWQNPATYTEAISVTYPEGPFRGTSVQLTASGSKNAESFSMVMELSQSARDPNKLCFEVNLKSSRVALTLSKALSIPAADPENRDCFTRIRNQVFALALTRAGLIRTHLRKYSARIEAVAKAIVSEVPGSQYHISAPEFFMHDDNAGEAGHTSAAFNLYVRSGNTDWNISPILYSEKREWQLVVCRGGRYIEDYGANWFDDGNTWLETSRWDEHLLEIMIPIMRADLL